MPSLLLLSFIAALFAHGAVAESAPQGNLLRTVLVTPNLYYESTRSLIPVANSSGWMNLTFDELNLSPFVYNLNLTFLNEWMEQSFSNASVVRGSEISKEIASLLDSQMSLLVPANSSEMSRLEKRSEHAGVVQYNVISSANTISSGDVGAFQGSQVLSNVGSSSPQHVASHQENHYRELPTIIALPAEPEHTHHHHGHHGHQGHQGHYNGYKRYPYYPYYVPKLISSGDAYYAQCPQHYSPSNGFLCSSDCPSDYYVKRGPVCLGKCASLATRPGAPRNEKWWSALLLCLRTWRVKLADVSDCPWYDVCGIGPAYGCAKCHNGTTGVHYKHRVGCTCHRAPALEWRYGSHVRSFKRYTCPEDPRDKLLSFEPLIAPVPLCYRCGKNPNDWRCK